MIYIWLAIYVLSFYCNLALHHVHPIIICAGYYLPQLTVRLIDISIAFFVTDTIFNISKQPFWFTHHLFCITSALISLSFEKTSPYLVLNLFWYLNGAKLLKHAFIKICHIKNKMVIFVVTLIPIVCGLLCNGVFLSYESSNEEILLRFLMFGVVVLEALPLFYRNIPLTILMLLTLSGLWKLIIYIFNMYMKQRS